MSVGRIRSLGRTVFDVGHLKKVSATRTGGYSRKSKNDEKPYKVVQPKKPSKDLEGSANVDLSHEFLAPTRGFPFILPGNVGPAWYNLYSTINNRTKFIMNEINTTSTNNMTCQVQECPQVLRQTVYDLFPNKNLQNFELSVVTISMRADQKMMRKNRDIETEKLAQMFVLAAHSICKKLRNAGYWADFINPFSGRPYLSPLVDVSLYTTDERFRCLDFQIFSVRDCKIVTNEQDQQSPKRFVGSLFTNAPSKKSHLHEIFTRID